MQILKAYEIFTAEFSYTVYAYQIDKAIDVFHSKFRNSEIIAVLETKSTKSFVTPAAYNQLPVFILSEQGTTETTQKK